MVEVIIKGYFPYTVSTYVNDNFWGIARMNTSEMIVIYQLGFLEELHCFPSESWGGGGWERASRFRFGDRNEMSRELRLTQMLF